MKVLPAAVLCALTSLVGCGADDDDGSKAAPYLGSQLVALADGAPSECTNYYGDLGDDEKKALPINHHELCPAENALGACELPAGATGELMTRNEVVYYVASDPHASLKDGDACDGSGTWRTPYPPQSSIDVDEGAY